MDKKIGNVDKIPGGQRDQEVRGESCDEKESSIN